MPLPDSADADWPPRSWRDDARLIDEARLWLIGNVEQLGSFYESAKSDPSKWRRFVAWLSRNTAAAETGDSTERLHVPLPRQIARTASALLFSQPPSLEIPDAHIDSGTGDDGKPLTPSSETLAARATEERISTIARADGWNAKLLQAALIASGTGGVYLRPNLNKDLVKDRPFLEVIHHDHAVPRFRSGQLVEVIFWVVVEVKGEQVWRHLECHTPGRVEHGLYVGTRRTLGDRARLVGNPATAGLPDEIDLDRAYGIDGLLPDYVPNLLPHPVTLSSTVGGADCAGLEDQLAALDQADTEWAVDIELGGRKVIIPQEFLARTGDRGGGAYLDRSQRVFSPYQSSALDHIANPFQLVDFDIRADQFEATVSNRTNRTAVAAGYTPDSVTWANTGESMTATEVLARDALSNDTTQAKRREWDRALPSMVEKLLRIDAAEFTGTAVTPMRPVVVWPEAEESERDVAERVNLWKLAGAASTQTRVATVHRDWDGERVAVEVERIRAEESLEVGDPTGFTV